MKPWGFLLLASLASEASIAQELNIVDVRRNITLHDDDVVYKDFYINGGEAEGLKKNLVVTAFRKVQVRDSSGAQSFGEILIPVGQLRVVATYGKVTVARQYKLLSRDDLPMLEQTGLMSGDKIDLKGSFIDNSKPVYKKKTAAVAPVSREATLIATATTLTATTTSSAAPTTATAQSPGPASVPPAEAGKLEKTADSSGGKAP